MIIIRAARREDAPALGALLAELGYAVVPEALAERLARLAASGQDRVGLAVEDGKALGLVALHWTAMVHLDKPLARITALVVRESERRRGVGSLLVEHAVRTAEQAGCSGIEVTTALGREAAQAFYRANGFQVSSFRLHRPL